MDNMKQNVPWEHVEYDRPVPVYRPPFPTGKQELILAALTLVFSLIACNALLYAGTNLGFAVGVIGLLVCGAAYLRGKGCKVDRYTGTLLALCILIVAAFARSSDGGLKFLMVCTLLTVPSLALCLIAGKNRYSPDGFLSLLDSPRTFFGLGFGRMGQSWRGLREAFRASGSVGRKGGAVALGLVIAIPLLAVMIPLLMFADAAFEGLLELLPESDSRQTVVTLLLGVPLAWLLYSRTVALQNVEKTEREAKERRGLNPLTVNTVLIAVALMYGAYLFSQLAYFVGGFAGILPEEYTMAEYARRGFFEMAWLCAINLAVIALSVGLVKREAKAPLSTRLICLFLGFVTLFLVAAASAKMFLYIGSYGLTRLRVLTEVFMLWLALTTVFVSLWLFREKIPYMKWVTVTGLAFCTVLMWVDVDAQVARYNVRAYQSGKLEMVDVDHLSELSDGTVPYLYELVYDADPETAQSARTALLHWDTSMENLRGWNYAAQKAEAVLEQLRMEQVVTELQLGSITGSLEVLMDDTDYGEYAVVVTLEEEVALGDEWKDLRGLPDELQTILYGTGSYQVNYFRVEGEPVLPQIENGLYYFYNRRTQTTDPEDVLAYSNKHYTVAVYDLDAGKLYFFTMDR